MAITFSDEPLGDVAPSGMGDPEPHTDSSPGLCDVCGLPLPPREPGQRGAARKRHEECRKATGVSPSATGRKGATSIDAMVDWIEGKYTLVGVTAKGIGFEADATVMLDHFTNPFTGQPSAKPGARILAEGWRATLETNPKVRQFITKAMKGSATGSLVGSHLAIGAILAQNHGVDVISMIMGPILRLMFSSKQAQPTEAQS